MRGSLTLLDRIRLVGSDREPLDLSQESLIGVFMKSMEAWSKEMGNNEDGAKFGFVDIEGLTLQPYGTAYVTA